MWTLLKETYNEWDRHNAPKLGAGLAYYTLLALAPLLIVIITVIGLGLGQQAAQGQIVDQIRQLVGDQGAEAIQTVIANSYQPKTGMLASLLGILTLFFGASGVFTELHDALNIIWDVPARTKTSVWSLVRGRIAAFGMLLAIGFVLLVSLVISAGVAATGKYMTHVLPIPEWSLEFVNLVFSLVVITVLFAAIYRFLPDDHVAWRDVWVGAAATSLLFTIGKTIIGIYLGKAGVASAYGAAGSLVVVLVWIYYSAQIFLFGAEFTHVYSKRRVPKAVS